MDDEDKSSDNRDKPTDDEDMESEQAIESPEKSPDNGDERTEADGMESKQALPELIESRIPSVARNRTENAEIKSKENEQVTSCEGFASCSENAETGELEEWTKNNFLQYRAECFASDEDSDESPDNDDREEVAVPCAANENLNTDGEQNMGIKRTIVFANPRGEDVVCEMESHFVKLTTADRDEGEVPSRFDMDEFKQSIREFSEELYDRLKHNEHLKFHCLSRSSSSPIADMQQQSICDANQEINKSDPKPLALTHQNENASSVPLNNENLHMNPIHSTEQPSTSGFHLPLVRTSISDSQSSSASTMLNLPGASGSVERRERASNELNLTGTSTAEVGNKGLSLNRDVGNTSSFTTKCKRTREPYGGSASDDELDRSLRRKKRVCKKNPSRARKKLSLTEDGADSCNTSTEVLCDSVRSDQLAYPLDVSFFEDSPPHRRSHKRSASSGDSPTSERIDASDNKKLKRNKSSEDLS